MSPFPRPEHQSDENKSHEKPTWPWEKASEGDEAKKKAEQTKKEKEEKKESPPKEEKSEEPAQKQDEEKRERRTTLIEQSMALVAKYEEEPIPHNANTLARLMIAHQVIHLNNQLEQPDGEHPLAAEEIEAALDYITQLDAKFKNPDIKAEPAIEQSYQEIMEMAEATLEEEPDIKKVVTDMGGQTPTNPAAPSVEPLDPLSTGRYLQPETKATPGPDFNLGAKPSSSERDRRGERGDNTEEEFDRRKYATKETIPAVATASALIYLITHLGRKKPRSKEEDGITTDGAGDYSGAKAKQSPPYELFYAEPSRSDRIVPVADRERTPLRRPSPALATAAVATAFAVSHARSERPRSAGPIETSRPAQESPKPTPESTSPTQKVSSKEPVANEFQRKIEHMPLLQLLTMAEGIDIGHGHYLRREFEAGHIDREGLVKILKSHSKGRDYQFEFRQQAGRFAKLKETSPEFLHQTKSADADEANNESLKEAQFTPPDTPPEIDKKATPSSHPFSLAPPTKYSRLPELASGIHQPKHTGRRLALITIATLAGLALVGWLAITIFSALS